MPGPHSNRISGGRTRHQYFLKSLQMILMHSQDKNYCSAEQKEDTENWSILSQTEYAYALAGGFIKVEILILQIWMVPKICLFNEFPGPQPTLSLTKQQRPCSQTAACQNQQGASTISGCLGSTLDQLNRNFWEWDPGMSSCLSSPVTPVYIQGWGPVLERFVELI